MKTVPKVKVCSANFNLTIATLDVLKVVERRSKIGVNESVVD